MNFLLRCIAVRGGGHNVQRNRLEALDAWRVVLPFLGIIYHVLLASTSGNYGNSFAWLATAVHAFRMEGFFVIAGFLAGGRLAQEGFVAARIRTLLVPLASLVLVANLLAPHRGTIIIYGSTQHLWFLVSMACCVLWSYVADRLALFEGLADATSKNLLLGILCAAVICQNASEDAAALMEDSADGLGAAIMASIRYLPYFILGITLKQNDNMAQLAKDRWIWIVAILLLACATWFIHWFPDEGAMDTPTSLVLDFLSVSASILCSVSLIGTSLSVNMQMSRSLKWLAAASYSIYLFHFFLVKAWAAAFTYSTLAEVLGAIVFISVGSLLMHWIISFSPVLLWLFNGKALPKAVPGGRIKLFWYKGA